MSVTPAAAFWYRATVRPQLTAPTDRRVVLVAGPGLAGAESEVAELQSSYPGSRCLIAADARAEAVATALDGADLAHVAAHGRFRADNPLFSSLEMADGPLTVYDLEALSQAPANLVLSACDSAVSEVCPGDDLMGLAAALLALGSRSLIASVLPVDDALTRPLMIALHQELRTGALPGDRSRSGPGRRLPRRRVSRGHGVGVRLSRVGIGVALAVVATTVAACGRTSTSIPPGTVVYAVGGTLDGFNVNTGKDSNEAARDVAVNTFFYAVKVAPDFTLTFPGLEGGAAPRVVSTNPQVVEWVIRREAVWSDGTPVTSEDLRYFHEQVMDPENDVATQVGYKQITNLEVVNDKTIRATFDPAYSEFQSLWTSVPQAAFMKAAPGGWNKGLNDEPGPSAGPYVVNTKLFVRGESLVLEPNPKWWGDPRPGIKSIVFRFISEGSQVKALKNGEVNLIAPAPAPDLVSTLKGLSDVRTDLAPSPEWPQLLFNPANPILAEPSVRRAIAHAVDRDAIVDLAVRPMMGSAAKLDSLDSFVYLPNQPGYEAHGAEYAHADAAMARKLLDEADWVPRGDGVREKAGRALSLRLSTSSDGSLVPVQELVRSDLEAVGFDVRVDNCERTCVVSQKLRPGDFDMVLLTWVGGAFPLTTVQSIYATGENLNFGKFSSASFDELIGGALATVDRGEAARLANEADKVLWEELPGLPLYQRPTLLAVRNGFTGIGDNSVGDGPLWNSAGWGVARSAS